MPVTSAEVVGLVGTPGATAKAAGAPENRWRLRGAPTPTRGQSVVAIAHRHIRRRRPWANFHLPQALNIPEVPPHKSVVVAGPEAVSFRKEHIPWADPHTGG